MADLLSDAPTSVPAAQQSNDPFAQWSSNTSSGQSKHQDIFDPLAEGMNLNYIKIFHSLSSSIFELI